MKIKEICEKTKLTERAVRLYIENGLVAPSINESYSGRRNVEFSAEDVKRLKSISVLRKAGFSIAQIKLMQQEPEKSKEVLQEFIDKTNERIKTDSEIVACLMPLLSLEKLVPEQISQSLEKPVVEEKLLPAEDSEPSALQKFIRKLFLSVGIIGLVFNVACLVPILWVEIRDIRGYSFPRYDAVGIFYMTIFFAPSILSATVILINRKKSVASKKKQKIKSVLTVLLIGIGVWCSIFTYCGAFLASVSNPEGFVVSQTSNIENYGDFEPKGLSGVWKTLSEFLPEKLPDVRGIKYKYWYKEFGGAPMDPQTEIFLEIPLDRESFDEAVEKYKAFRPSDSACEPYEEKINDWTLIYYREDHERAPTNYDPVFAFNEKECKIRLMCEYGNVASKGATIHNASFLDEYKW